VAVLALLAATLGSLACGYKLLGVGSGVIPRDVHSIVVLPFENRTNRPEIEQRVTEQLASLLARRSGYSVVTDRSAADAVLEGAVVAYHTTPVQFTSEGRANRVEVIVTLQAILRKTADDSVLWSQSGLIFKEQYDLPPETSQFFDQESVAQDEIARGAAGAVVTSILEGF
jgi:TolB-like protein